MLPYGLHLTEAAIASSGPSFTHRHPIQSFPEHRDLLAFALQESLVDGDQFVERMDESLGRCIGLRDGFRYGVVVETVYGFRAYAQGGGYATEPGRVDPFALLELGDCLLRDAHCRGEGLLFHPQQLTHATDLSSDVLDRLLCCGIHRGSFLFRYSMCPWRGERA